MIHFSVDRFLGRPYDRRRYHCWHLVCEAWLDLTGTDLGPVPDWDEREVLARFSAFAASPEPVSPCIVLMLTPPSVPHAGVFLRGRVLHIRPEGARFERLKDATRGFEEVRYYAARNPHREPARTG